MDIKVTFPGGKKVDAEVGGFTIKTDQSEKSGGEGSAPEPSKLFFASLATCAGYYALAFCQSRKIPTEGLDLRMSCEVDPKTKLVGRVIVDLTLPEGFPEKYREAIQKAVDACYVKKHLFDSPEFQVRLA